MHFPGRKPTNLYKWYKKWGTIRACVAVFNPVCPNPLEGKCYLCKWNTLAKEGDISFPSPVCNESLAKSPRGSGLHRPWPPSSSASARDVRDAGLSAAQRLAAWRRHEGSGPCRQMPRSNFLGTSLAVCSIKTEFKRGFLKRLSQAHTWTTAPAMRGCLMPLLLALIWQAGKEHDPPSAKPQILIQVVKAWCLVLFLVAFFVCWLFVCFW